MNFITYYDLVDDVSNNISLVPGDIDIVVGIPRSGMLVASLISLYLNKPLSDLQNIMQGNIYKSGITKNLTKHIKNISDVSKILIVEDSTASGDSILNAKKLLSSSEILKNKKIEFLAAYVEKSSRNMVDYYFKTVEQPRMFEWNYLHHAELIHCCVDIDGVLCEDPTDVQNDDGEAYIKFVTNAITKYQPTRKIGSIVTSRLEKYREQTENWLAKVDISYERLIMMNADTAEERRTLGNHADFKASFYKNCKDSILFIESEDYQAQRIHQLTGKSVFCTGSHKYYDESARFKIATEQRSKYISWKMKLRRKIKRILPNWTVEFILKTCNK